jgi:hypothetical protein
MTNDRFSPFCVYRGKGVAALLVAALAMITASANATTLPVGGSVTPNSQANPFTGSTIVGNTGVENYSASLNGESISGTAQEWVLQGFAGNPFGAADLTFVLQVSLTGGTSNNGGSPILERIANSGYGASVQTDVGYNTASGQVAPSSANRPTGGNLIAFNFLPPGQSVSVGQSTYFLIVNTDATAFAPSTITIQNSVAANVAGFGATAVPEPGSLALLGLGAVGGLLALWKKRA